MTVSPALSPAIPPGSVAREREAVLLASVPTGLLINGQWRDASDGGTFDVHDPATGEVLATLASATSADAVAALDAADAAQASWARTAPRVRAEILRNAFDLVTERTEDFALLARGSEALAGKYVKTSDGDAPASY